MKIGDFVIPNDLNDKYYSHIVTKKQNFVGKIIDSPEIRIYDEESMWIKVVYSDEISAKDQVYVVRKDCFENLKIKIPNCVIQQEYESR